MSFTRRGSSAALVAACLLSTALVAPVAAAGVPVPGRGSPDARSTDAGSTETGGLVPTFASVTGVREGAPTVLAGGILNQAAEPADVTVRLSELADGTTIAAVRPDTTHPEPDGAGGTYAWRCAELTCRLLGADGEGRELPHDRSVPLLLALEGRGLRPGATATVTVGDARPDGVPLDRRDGRPALGAEALSAALSGAGTVAPGTTSTVTATVGNVGTAATSAGSLVADITGPAVDGTVVTAAGDGWTCAGLRCSTTAALEPYESAPPLTITTTAAPTGEGTGTLRFGATATSAAGTAIDAEATLDLVVRAPDTKDVSLRFGRLSQASLAAPATQDVPLFVTPTGRLDDGTLLHDPVTVTFDVEAHVTVDWARAGAGGPWSCSAEHERCTSTGALPAGRPTLLSVPVTYEHGAVEGVSTLWARASTGDGDEPAEASTSIVVNPPPKPELRARITSTASAEDLPGAPLQFAVDAPRPLTVQVTNHGSRPALAGSELDVVITPDVDQAVERAGGGGWRCTGFSSDGERNGDGPKQVAGDTRLRCSTTLHQDLASEATLDLPVTLAPSTAGSSRWEVTTSLDGRRAPGDAPQFRVDVESDVPRLVPDLEVDHGLVRGGVGSVQVTLTNRGLLASDGGVLVVDLPQGVRPSDIAGEGWTCPDTAVDGAHGHLTCVTDAEVPPGATTPPVRLELSVAKSRHDDVDVWMWATGPGQDHPSGTRAGTTVTLPVHDEEAVDAGDDLTVVTPVTGPDGQPRPATVLLRGEASGSLARHVSWQQRCTVEGEEGCDGVEPAVTWSGVAPGQHPTTAVARFTAPDIDAPTTLHLRLTGSNGGSYERHSDMEVHLVPAASTALGNQVDRSSGSAGSAPSTAAVPSGSGPSAPDEVSVAIGDGSVLQVATRDQAVLSATATGTGPFTWSWQQTSGPDATVVGASASADLVFTAPSLEPDQTSQDLGFEVTVTDALGGTATATAEVEVVWGDDGLEVSVADGADAVVAQVGGPVVITSQVTSAGAPYTYRWSFDGGDVDLPSGTDTSDPSLSFTAPDGDGETTVQLQVTDSFGRVTVASVPLDVTELPADEVPVALCDALSSLSAGLPGVLSGADGTVAVTIPSSAIAGTSSSRPATTTTTTTPTTPTTTTGPATTTTTTPAASCPSSSRATFTNAGAVLPGGLSVTGASGRLSIAGVLLSEGTVVVPAAWGAVTLEIPSDGLLLPFVTSEDIGLPLGALQGDGVPFTGVPGWDATTTVTFPSGGSPYAAIDATTADPSGDGHVSMTGRATGWGTTQVQVTAVGLAGVGPVDVALSGTLTTARADAPVVSTVQGSLATPVPLAADVTLRSAQLSWTPGSDGGTATGAAELGLGAGAPLVLTAAVSDPGPGPDDGATALSIAGQPWTPGGSTGPRLVLGGTGSVTGGSSPHLQLQLTGPSAAPWQPGTAVLVAGLVPTVAADCDLQASTACGPSAELSGSLAVGAPVGTGATVAVSGGLSTTTGTTTLTADTGTLSVAPLTVAATRLTTLLSPGTAEAPGSVVTTASGTSSVLGAERATKVTFGPAAVVAAASTPDLQPVPGWTLDGTVALAASAATTYQFGAGDSAVTVPVPAGSLTGAALTTMPTALSDGVLPPSVTSGAITFPVDPGPSPAAPTSFQLDVADPDGWYLVGDADAAEAGAPSLTVDSVTWAITVEGNAVTVSAAGGGTLAVPSLPGTSGGTAPPLTFAGTLAAGGDGGVLSLTYGAGTSAWTGTYGVVGLTVAAATVQVTATTGSVDALLSGAATIGGTLASVLGTPSGPSLSFSAPLTAAAGTDLLGCPTVDLAGAGLDVGGLGLVATGTASVLVAATACAGPSATVDPGVTVTFSEPNLGSGSFAVDPTTSAVDGALVLPGAEIDGLTFPDMTIDLSTADPGPEGTPVVAMSVSGTTTLASQPLELSGEVVPPTAGVAYGTIVLTSAEDQQISVPGSTGAAGDDDALTVTTEGLTVQVDALAGPGTPRFVLAGTAEVLGVDDAGVWMEGTATGSAITALDGCVTGVGGTPPTAQTPDPCATPPQVRFPLPVAGDTLTTSISISYDAASTPALHVNSPEGGATLSADGFTFATGSVTLTSSGFQVTSSIAVPGSSGQPVSLRGDYQVDPGAGDGSPGDFELRTPSSTSLGFSGFSASGRARFARSAGKASARLHVELTPGLFDEDTAVKLEGTIDADGTSTLTGTAEDVTFRGLSGDATFTVEPGTESTDPATQALGLRGWYQTSMSMKTDAGDCDMWSGAPDLTGVVYRSGTVTYYTLTGTTDVSLPSPISEDVTDPQPLVLSNEWVGMSGQPSTGITVATTFHTSTFTATGTISLQPAQCSYGVSGTVVFGFDQGAVAGEMHGALMPATGLNYQSGGLFGPGGTLPPDIEVTRTSLELDALVAQLTAAKENAAVQNLAAEADLYAAETAATNAQQKLAAAQQALVAQQQRLAAAQTAAEESAGALAQARLQDDQDATDYAEEALYDARDEVGAATAAVATANASVATASTRSTNAANDQQQAATDAAAAADALEEATAALAKQNGIQATMLTVDLTHCDTCDPPNTFSIGGELFFDIVWVAGADITLGWGDGSFDEIEGSLSLGIQKQFSVGGSHLGAYASASGTATFSLGYDFQGTGWFEFDVDLELEAQISAYLSFWYVSYTATLLAVQLQAGMEFLPPPISWSGQFGVDVFGYELTGGFGPEPFP